jgi:ATP-binding cassette subfamily B protein
MERHGWKDADPPAVKSGKAHYNASKEAANHTRRAQYLQGVLTGRDNTEERSLFGYADALNYRYYEKYLAAYKINMKAQRKRYIRVKTASVITLLLSALIAGVLIAPLGSGEISIGMFMGFVTATFGLVQMLSWELTYITSELASHREYLRDLTLFANFSETPGAVDMPVSQGIEPQCIEFCNVSFAYPGCMGEQDTKCPTSPGCMGEQDTKCPTSPGRMGEQDTKCPTSPGTNGLILKNLSLKLYAKKHYAFVGVNGAGKTTITKLLTGLYDNYTGDILIDGKNLRDFSQAELKAMFAIVYQDFAKYQIRLLDSIGIGNINGVSEQNIASTIKTLGLADMVSKLPEGTQTPLGKIKGNGVDLSGGEWQRIAIARSLISSAPIHILDEPTAALDPAAESELYELFAKISKGKSTIFITHRLGAARLADEIFVIADGHVAEQGAHDKLISKNGMYAEMFEAQRGWYG